MAHRIILFFMLFFIININVSFCADNFPTLTLGQCDGIFNFAINTSKISNKTNYNSSTPSGLMNYFNSNIAETIYFNTNKECDSSYHFIVLCKETSIYFLITNATLSSVLEYIYIDCPYNNSNFSINFEYAIKIDLNGNDSYKHQFLKNSFITASMFYLNDSPTKDIKISDDGNTIISPNLYYLGPKSFSETYIRPYNGTYKSYFLQYFYGSINVPSGDSPSGPSGDSPSGPSGDSPNYNDKLDNISGLITSSNHKLDGISGEIGKTNNKLEGISGELGEINDNLTTVPDLSGIVINSGDIESALNFDFAEDPYSNFWLEVNTGLSSALTSNNRSITIDFRNETYNINLDDFALQVPEFLKSFLAIISTVLVVWQILRYIKLIVDKISSGDMDTVLAMNEEERNS